MVGSLAVFVLPSRGGGTNSNRATSERTPVSSPLPTVVETTTEKIYSAPPPLTVDPERSYFATIKTEKGDIRLELDVKAAPNAVNNFLFLARDGFYDGLTFYRVIPGYYVQAGDPAGDGSGGPGYVIEGDPEGLKLNNITETVAMINVGPDAFGSQFSIALSPQPDFDGKNVVFGHVTEGMDVLANLTPREPTERPGSQGDRIETIVIVIEEE